MWVLSMFNTGQITLPKKWRSQFKTNKFVAKEEAGKLIIEAFVDIPPEGLKEENVDFFEDNKGVDIHFKKGLGKEEIEYLKTHLLP